MWTFQWTCECAPGDACSGVAGWLDTPRRAGSLTALRRRGDALPCRDAGSRLPNGLRSLPPVQHLRRPTRRSSAPSCRAAARLRPASSGATLRGCVARVARLAGPREGSRC
ncbi:MAG: hypothetical protein MZW92_25375 [Comamonadaceae bacterium]|nr:hypothetical protein [Comamonadaceae bacterium]